jgi:hypothetical protein
MTPSNLNWDNFVERLKKKLEAVDCKSGRDKTQAMAVLREMGLKWELIAPTLAYFESHGGFCDCEIIYNIALEE